jgi:hypothetical protein
MAETPKQKQKGLKVIGIYIIIILALLRFLIYPLHASLQEKKVLLGEWYESYRLKSRVQERQERDQGEKTLLGKDALLLYFYDKGVLYSNIQSEIIEQIISIAGKKGLTVLNFEMLEPGVGKGVSEVPILIRLRGSPGAFIETLEIMEKGEKTLSVRSMEITQSGQDQVFSLTLSAFRLEK